MSKILVNNNGFSVDVVDAGVTIGPSSSYTIPPQDYPVFAASSDVIVLLANGTLLLNDGSSDISSISGAVDIIKGWFPGAITQTPFFFDFTGTITGDLPTVVIGYTVPAGENHFLSRVDVSCRIEAVIQVLIDSVPVADMRSGAAVPSPGYSWSPNRPVLPGQLVEVVITKREKTADIDIGAYLKGVMT